MSKRARLLVEIFGDEVDDITAEEEDRLLNSPQPGPTPRPDVQEKEPTTAPTQHENQYYINDPIIDITKAPPTPELSTFLFYHNSYTS